MTVPTNLFIDAPESEDPSMTQVSSDSTEWPEQAITKLKERIPASANFSLSVKFMAKDDEIGTATGSITITDGEKAAVVPVIVHDFQMYPLDVFFFQGRILPLTMSYFAQVFSGDGESAFAALSEFPMLNVFERYMRGESLQNVIFPPNWGRYAYASADDVNEKYPVLNEIKGSIDGDAFKKMAEQDPHSVVRYSEKQPGLMAKLANLRPVNMMEFRQGVDNLIMRTVHVLKKDGPNKYTILSNARNTFNPAISACDRHAVRAFISKVCDKVDDILTEVDQNGEKAIIVDDHLAGISPLLTQPDTGRVISADHYGLYAVRTKTGVNVTGLVVPQVIDFEQNPVDTKIFLGKTISTMQPDIWGVEMTGQDRWMPQGGRPLVGQTGTFFLCEGMKAGLATVPVTIKSAMSVEGVGMNLEVVSLDGISFRIKVLPESSRVERIIPMGNKTYILPSKMTWVPMEGFDDISSNPYAYAEKMAAESGHQVLISSTGYGCYCLGGVDKYAEALKWDKTFLDKSQTMFLLGSLGLGENKIASVLKEANSLQQTAISFRTMPPLVEEKVASYEGKAREAIKIANQIRTNLFKEASYIENAQTVDALLSLNFVTPENVAKFISKIALFKSAISHLASCLIASRVGIREIPEQSTASAMHKLNDVVEGLEALRAVQAGKK